MKYELYSYRYAQEILEHPNNREAFDEIISAVAGAPLFLFPHKSSKNAKLDVVQQVMNTWFDRVLGVDCGWDYHPLATRIPNSGLAADFRKAFPNITVQAEVQFGNMSRWYSDVFKFQTAYSQNLIHLGLCIVPMGALARRIDSNVVSFERVLRELPSAEMWLTLPILVVGVDVDEDTPTHDLSHGPFPLALLTKKIAKKLGSSEHNRYRVVHAVREQLDLTHVTAASPTGPMAKPLAIGTDLDAEEED